MSNNGDMSDDGDSDLEKDLLPVSWEKLRKSLADRGKGTSTEGARQALNSMTEHLAGQLELYVGKREEYEQRLEGLDEREAALQAREADLEMQIDARATEIARQDATGYYTTMAEVMLSDSTDVTKRTAICSLLRGKGVSNEEAVNLLLGIDNRQDIQDHLKVLGLAVDEHVGDVRALIAVSEAAEQVQKEQEQKEQKLDERIAAAAEMEKETGEKEQRLIAREITAEEARMALVENIGRARSLYNLLEKLSGDVRNSMFPDFKRYRARVDDIQRAYGVRATAVILSKNYLDQLAAEEDAPTDITTGLNTERTIALKKLIIRTRGNEGYVIGQDDDLGSYFITPISTESGLLLADFCLVGLPKNGGDITEEYRGRLVDVADSVKRTVQGDYAIIHTLSQKGQLGYALSRLERFEQELRQLSKS